MKYSFFSLMLFISLKANAQMNRDSLLRPDKIFYATDSFHFCSKTLKVPRQCDDTLLNDCCVFYLSQNQISCGLDHGDSMIWAYLPDADMAQDIFKGMLGAMESNYKKFSQKPINCWLLGTKVNSRYVETEAYTGMKEYQVIAYGIVNGQALVFQYFSDTRINVKTKLNSIFNQVISLQ